ncbi:hypothetical protein, partial [Salmonella sp. s55962]|uniref:hypothetical protein n=1 Tax=Salmonella sp. s55962 TaxID=3159685 RepID=UPI00397F25B0
MDGEHLVSKDLQDHQERQDHRAVPVDRVYVEPKVPMVKMAVMVLQVYQEPQDPRVYAVVPDDQEYLADEDTKVSLVFQVPEVARVTLVDMEPA